MFVVNRYFFESIKPFTENDSMTTLAQSKNPFIDTIVFGIFHKILANL